MGGFLAVIQDIGLALSVAPAAETLLVDIEKALADIGVVTTNIQQAIAAAQMPAPTVTPAS